MKNNIENIISFALEEDIGNGDITTEAVIPAAVHAEGRFLIKANGIIAGLEVAERVFKVVDHRTIFKLIKGEGTFVDAGSIAAEVMGSAASILKAERTALNFLQRMSGIATLTNEFVEEIKHTKAKILDTRKTVPGLRLLDKEAVRIGGGKNHRIGLFDLFLVKDNHIEVAGSIKEAVKRCRHYQRKTGSAFKIEVETKTIDEVEEALKCEIDVIMLDNFETASMKQAVEQINGKCLVEASGNINLQNVRVVAETGIDYISVGALTHSVKALDISLELHLIG